MTVLTRPARNTHPTRATDEWSAALSALESAVQRADHPRLTEHHTMASSFLADAGAPTKVWANRIAAMVVIAHRRADTAPTMSRRSDYLEVAVAASALLALGQSVHGAAPDETAQAYLAQIHRSDCLAGYCCA